MERSKRFILFLAAAALSLPLFSIGHGPSRKDGPVAFLPYTSTGVTVRLAGNVKSRGMYAFGKDVTIADVINMTVPVTPAEMPEKTLLDVQLKQGDVVEISSGTLQLLDIHVKTMKARERMLLGIPLHPDRMERDDWQCLPGVGPKLAQRILNDRQINGDFYTVEAVRRVSGIGEKKFNMLRKYF